MTLAVLGKVPAGFILATDRMECSPGISHFRFADDRGASRIFLSQKRPLGALLWGGGTLRGNVLSEIAVQIENSEETNQPSLGDIANDLAHLLTQRGRHEFSSLRPYLLPRIGFFLAGFEREGKATAKDWVWEMASPFAPPRPLRTDRPGEPQYGFNWRGQELPMTRLLLGYDPSLLDLLESNLSTAQERLLPFFRRLELPISYSSMDLEQAMEMAAYMINTTTGLLHIQSRPRNWSWRVEMAIITPEGTRRVMPQELDES